MTCGAQCACVQIDSLSHKMRKRQDITKGIQSSTVWKSKRTPVKSQNVLPTKSNCTIDKVKTYPSPLLTNQGQMIYR